jgi:uncharacterized protein (UPF0147 family)
MGNSEIIGSNVVMPPETWQRPSDSNHELRLLRSIVGDSDVNRLIRHASQKDYSLVQVAAYNVELYKALALGMRPPQDDILES